VSKSAVEVIVCKDKNQQRNEEDNGWYWHNIPKWFSAKILFLPLQIVELRKVYIFANSNDKFW
jgi:hypothetical protein